MAASIVWRRNRDMSPTPLVSIVVATYNRAHVVAHAIASVRRSTVTDWELIVVGDRCTDDTEAVVAGFADPRITWVNLPENAGEQSGPNNEGIRPRPRPLSGVPQPRRPLFPRSPGHARSPAAKRPPPIWSGRRCWSRCRPPRRTRGRPGAVPPQRRHSGDDYDPRVFVFASSWLMRRELTDRVGPWRSGRDTFVTASQDWIFRAWRSGARLRFHAHVGVLAVPASVRAAAMSPRAAPSTITSPLA